LATSPFSNFNFKKTFAIIWIIWFMLHSYSLYSFGIDWKIAIQDGALSSMITGIFCWFISNNLAYYQPKPNKYSYIIIWCLFLALFVCLFIKVLFPEIISTEADYITFLNSSLTIRFGFAFLLIGWMAMISVLWYNQQEKEELEMRRNEVDKLNKEAELSSLREKLQPHFLFNSLNSISALTFSKPAEARKMINQLSDFLRGTIRKDDQLTTLETEINHLKLYLEIEMVRFGHRLDTQISCTDVASNLLIPPMILQPLVENAIKFGLYDTIDKVTITISCNFENSLLNISITNPFDPSTAYPNNGTGFGLASVKRRLSLIYNRKDLLQTSTSNQEFTTTISIPQI
jgi:two-component system LytT family sensor kinase